MRHALTPLEPPYSSEVDAVLSQYPKGADGYVLKLFRLFANSLRFLGSKGVVNLLDKGSPLRLRERELVILRTTFNCGCEYEWGVHAAIFSELAKINAEQLRSICDPDLAGIHWQERDRLLLACVDALCNDARIGAVEYALFQNHWTREQQLEIFALCGNYHTISFVANSTRLENEAFAPGFSGSTEV